MVSQSYYGAILASTALAASSSQLARAAEQQNERELHGWHGGGWDHGHRGGRNHGHRHGHGGGWGSHPTWGAPPGGWDRSTSSWSSSSSSSGKSGKSGGGSGKSGKSGYFSSSSSSSDDHHGHHGYGQEHGHGYGYQWDPPTKPSWHGDFWDTSSSSSSSSSKSGKSGGHSKSGKGSSSSSTSTSHDGGHWVWTSDPSNHGPYHGHGHSHGWSSPPGTTSWSSSSSSGKSGKSGGSGSGKSGKSGGGSRDSSASGDDDGWDGDGWYGGDDNDSNNDWAGDGHNKEDDNDGADGNSWKNDGHPNKSYDTNYCTASCTGSLCTYTALVDLFSSEFGFYTFEECNDGKTNMPTISMELGKTYRFIQKDVTNYLHPLGFAYEPDGALAGAPEVEDEYLAYQLDGKDIGLDEYEPNFAHPIGEWASDGEYSVEVTIPKTIDWSKDLFYFCHIHRYLGGRIKLLKNGKPIQPYHNLPEVSILPPPPSEYDEHCGTYGLVHNGNDESWDGDAWPHSMPGDHRLTHPECPHTFVCEENKSTFASCLDAINCHMFNGMTTYDRYGDKALFLHQMIPHHQNAVNMAKSLLLHWDYECAKSDLGEDSNECIMENIIRSIINAQNQQIQMMRDLLVDNDWPEFDNCDIKYTSVEGTEKGSDYVYGPWYYGWQDDGHGERALELDDLDAPSPEERRTPEDKICRGACWTSKKGEEVCKFTARVDFYASDLGAFYFEECGADNIYPDIGIEIGKKYIFVQADRSNYYHPLGFAYTPDGAHAGHDAGHDEMEEEFLTYRLDGKDVGLDEYEPLFFHSAGEWAGYGTFTVDVKYEGDHGSDLFYFCHIHEFMSGRIKLLKNDTPIQQANLPSIKYNHPTPDPYDKSCGTYGLAPFQLPHPECPNTFVCDKHTSFAGCIETMNCFMMVGMTTYAYGGNDGDVALFNHQMIPHHENAVNMAKALLKTGELNCESLTYDTVDCTLEKILREIVNNQNYQIQSMYRVLESDGFPKTNDCVVNVSHH